MKINTQLTTTFVAAVLLFGGFGRGFLFPLTPANSSTAPAHRIEQVQPNSGQGAQEVDENEGDDVEDPNEVDDATDTESNDTEGSDEADAVAPSTTGITAEEAQTIAEGANPGAKTLAVEFDRENGSDLFEVELDNGLDVKVDAANGNILLTEVRDAQ